MMPLISNWFRRLGLLTSKHGLEWYPPFRSMRIRVLELDSEWQHVRILLPLSKRTMNPGGSMFGGSIACLADPIAALACAKIFPDYLVWTHHLSIDFLHESRCDLELRFTMAASLRQEIQNELGKRGRSTPEFEYGLYNQAGKLCVKVKNRVAIRHPTDHRGSGGALKHP